MKKIVIAGASGFGREVLWVIKRMNAAEPLFEVAGFCDDAPDKQSGEFAGLPLLGSVARVCSTMRDIVFFCAVGDNRARKKIFAQFASASVDAVKVMDPSSVIADDAVIGKGCYIGVNAVVSTGTAVGCGVIVNHNVSVGHDVEVGAFAQICPGVSVSGGCRLGEGALLGSNSCMIPGKRMGDWSTLGAGAVLLTDLEDGGSRVRIR